MTLYVPEASKSTMLTSILTNNLTLKLYSNNYTPIAASLATNFTEVTGGGYANKPLTLANWTITDGSPAVALYNAVQDFNFTGATTGPGTIYGYYIVRTSGGLLLYAERFPADDVPFVSINGSLIRITPRITLDNA